MFKKRFVSNLHKIMNRHGIDASQSEEIMPALLGEIERYALSVDFEREIQQLKSSKKRDLRRNSRLLTVEQRQPESPHEL